MGLALLLGLLAGLFLGWFNGWIVTQFELHSWFKLHECAKSIPGDLVPLPSIGNPLLDPRREGAQLVHIP